MVDNNYETLSDIEVFSQLNDDQLLELEKKCKWLNFNNKDTIIDQNSNSRDVYFIAEGAVRIVYFTQSGREVALETLHRGKCFGELAAIDGGLRSSSVVATEDSLISKMSASDFVSAMNSYPSIGLKVMIMMASVIRTSSDRIIDLITLSANARILLELIKQVRHAPDKGNSITIRNFPVHNIIASRASTTRETVTRVFSALAKKGIIQRNGNSLEIRDLAVLKRTYINLINKDV